MIFVIIYTNSKAFLTRKFKIKAKEFRINLPVPLTSEPWWTDVPDVAKK